MTEAYLRQSGAAPFPATNHVRALIAFFYYVLFFTACDNCWLLGGELISPLRINKVVYLLSICFTTGLFAVLL